MILNILLLILIFIVSYQLINNFDKEKTYSKISKYISTKNEQYYEELLKHYDKNKKVKIISKINMIKRIGILIDRSGIKRGILINPITIIIFCLLSFLLAYIVAFKVFKIVALALIIAFPFILTPIGILNLIAGYNRSKMEKIIPNFLLQLKNYTQINNDIIYAIKEVDTIKPLNIYLNKFLLEINNGVKFENAIDNLNEKIKIRELEMFFSNIKNCYLRGGSFSNLISKSYYMITEIQKEKSSRDEETKGARIVLWILIALDLFVYFNFIKNNQENYIIMQKSIFGNFILYWNFISMWLLMFLSYKVKKVDE